MAKLEDASALGADAARFAGSNPAPRHNIYKIVIAKNFIFRAVGHEKPGEFREALYWSNGCKFE